MNEPTITEMLSISTELAAAEGRLEELISATSIDFLGASTRAFMDKTVLVSAIGTITSTLGSLDRDATLGPFKITINATWVIPTAVLFAVVLLRRGIGAARANRFQTMDLDLCIEECESDVFSATNADTGRAGCRKFSGIRRANCTPGRRRRIFR